MRSIQYFFDLVLHFSQLGKVGNRVSWSAGTILQGSKVDLRMHRGSLS